MKKKKKWKIMKRKKGKRKKWKTLGTRNDPQRILESLSWYKTVVHFLCQNGRRRQEQLQKGLYDHNWRECRVKSAQLGDLLFLLFWLPLWIIFSCPGWLEFYEKKMSHSLIFSLTRGTDTKRQFWPKAEQFQNLIGELSH